MSHEVKQDDSLKYNGSDSQGNDDHAKASDTNDGASVDSAVNQGPKKTRGIGFLGRRGTAPIRTGKANDSTDGDKKNEDDANSNTDKTEPRPLGFAEKVFTSISNIPTVAFLFLLCLLAAHSVMSVVLPTVFFSHELHLTQVYSDMIGMGHWLMPPTTEHIKAVFPGFYWFMSLVDMLIVHDSIFLPVVAVLVAFMTLVGTYSLGLCAGLNKRISLAAGLILLASPGFATLGHTLSPDLFAAGLFAFALAFLCKGWISESNPLSFVLGFLFLTLATLSGGFLPLWTVLISNILFILWRGTIGRANQFDSVLGFGVMILLFALWLIIIIIGGGPQADSLDVLMEQMITPFVPPFWPLKSTWYEGLLLLAFAVLPWMLLPLFASWFKVLKNCVGNLKAARKENSGVAWLYINLVVGCALLILSGEFNIALILLPVLVILLAKTLCNLSGLGSKVFFAILAILSLILGLILLGLSFASTASMILEYLPQNIAGVLQNVQGFDLLGGILVVGSVVLFKFTKRESAGGPLLVVTLFTLLLVQPCVMYVAPSLSDDIAKQHPAGAGIDVFGTGATAPIKTAPAETAPMETVPAEIAPAETAPVETAPMETAPMETAPAQEQVEPPLENVSPSPELSVPPQPNDELLQEATDSLS